MTQSPAAIPIVTLNDGNTLPVIGLGVGELSESETEQSVSAALEAGYRLIDTASAYGNEAAVGRAIASSGIPREEVFVTTKLATQRPGLPGVAGRSEGQPGTARPRLRRPLPDPLAGRQPGKYVDSWGGLMKRKELGDTKSIGLANFHAEDLSNVIDLSFFTPAVNQIELHPLLNQAELRATNAEYGIVTEAYGPLGVGTCWTMRRSDPWRRHMARRRPRCSSGGAFSSATSSFRARRHRSGSSRISTSSTSS